MAEWQTKRLGDVCERVTVGHVGITTTYYREKGVLFLRTQNVGEQGLDLTDRKFITADFHAKIRKSQVQAGDILVSRVITHTVRCAQAPDDLGPANCANVVLVRPGSELSGDFLLHYIRSPQGQRYLLSRRVGSAQLVVNTTVIQDWPVPFPALPEQRRIVAILDEAFEGIATAKANAEKNLQNARDLFEAVQRELMCGAARRSETRELQSLCDVFFDSAHRTPKYQADGIPALRPRDVVNGALNLSVAARVSQDEYEIQSKRYKPREGDIVYSRELSYGWAAIVPAATMVCLSQGMCVFRPTEGVSSRFVWRMLNGPIGRSQAHQAAVGTAHPHINLGAIKAYRIPYLPVEQQHAMVESLDEIEAEVESLASIAKQKRALLDELKQSLLHRAFTGALTSKGADVQVAEVA